MSAKDPPPSSTGGLVNTGSMLLDNVNFNTKYVKSFFKTVNKEFDRLKWTNKQRCRWFLDRFTNDPMFMIYRYNHALLSNDWVDFYTSCEKEFLNDGNSSLPSSLADSGTERDYSINNLILLVRDFQYHMEKPVNLGNFATKSEPLRFLNEYITMATHLEEKGKMAARDLTQLMVYAFPTEIQHCLPHVIGPGLFDFPSIQADDKADPFFYLLKTVLRLLASEIYHEYRSIYSWYERALNGSGFSYKSAISQYAASPGMSVDGIDDIDPIVVPKTGARYSEALKLCITFGHRWKYSSIENKSMQDLTLFEEYLAALLEHQLTLKRRWSIPLLLGSVMAVVGKELGLLLYITNRDIFKEKPSVFFDIVKEQLLSDSGVQTSWRPSKLTVSDLFDLSNAISQHFRYLFLTKPLIYSSSAGPVNEHHRNPKYFYTETVLELYDQKLGSYVGNNDDDDFVSLTQQIQLTTDAFSEIVVMIRKPLIANHPVVSVRQRPMRFMMTAFYNALRMCVEMLNKGAYITILDLTLGSVFILAFFEIFEFPIGLLRDLSIAPFYHNFRDVLGNIIDIRDYLAKRKPRASENPALFRLLWQSVYVATKELPQLIERAAECWEQACYWHPEVLSHVFDKSCFFAAMENAISKAGAGIKLNSDGSYSGLDNGYLRDALMHNVDYENEDGHDPNSFDLSKGYNGDVDDLSRMKLQDSVTPTKCPFCDAVSHYELWDCPLWLSYYPKECKQFYTQDKSRPIVEGKRFQWSVTEEYDARDYLQFRRAEDGVFEDDDLGLD